MCIIIREKLGEATFHNLDHIRIKAMRSFNTEEYEINERDASIFKNEFFDYIFANPDGWPDDIQVDLSLRYFRQDERYQQKSFECFLSPLCAVVDPTGSLYACWNYMGEDVGEKLVIADLSDKEVKFKNVWGSPQHRKIASKMDYRKICDAKNGCPCRFIEYQEILEKAEGREEPDIPEALKGFF